MLGVPPDAPVEAIKRAYRKKASTTHPDKAGGSTTGFQELQRAWSILKDPEKRAQFDAFGEKSEGTSIREKAEGEAINLIVSAALKLDVAHTDLIQRVCMNVRNRQREIEQAINLAEKDRAKMLDAAARLKRVKGAENLAKRALEMSAENIDVKANGMRFDMELCAEILKVLDEYSYRVDDVSVQSSPFGGLFINTTL